MFKTKQKDDVAPNALTSPVTTSLAEGSFRVMMSLLTYDCRFISRATQIVYLLAVITGDANEHIPSWALSVITAALSSKDLVSVFFVTNCLSALLLYGALFFIKKKAFG